MSLTVVAPDARRPWPPKKDPDAIWLSGEVAVRLQMTMISPPCEFSMPPAIGHMVDIGVQNTWRHWNTGAPLERDPWVQVRDVRHIHLDSSDWITHLIVRGDACEWDPLWYPEDTASKLLGLMSDLLDAGWVFLNDQDREFYEGYRDWWEKEFPILEALADGAYWQVNTPEDISSDGFVEEIGQ